MYIYSPMPHTLSYCALIGKCALIRSITVVICGKTVMFSSLCVNIQEELQGFFLCTSGADYGPLSQYKYPIFSQFEKKKKIPNQKINLSIGTPANNKFSICSKWKINYFLCPKIKTLYSLVIKFLNIGTPKNR